MSKQNKDISPDTMQAFNVTIGLCCVPHKFCERLNCGTDLIDDESSNSNIDVNIEDTDYRGIELTQSVGCAVEVKVDPNNCC